MKTICRSLKPASDCERGRAAGATRAAGLSVLLTADLLGFSQHRNRTIWRIYIEKKKYPSEQVVWCQG